MTIIIYLVVINIISYLLYRCNKTNKNKLLSILTIISLLGGNIGVLLYILIHDRKITKENALLRIVVINITIIQVLFLFKYYNIINNTIINYLKRLDIIFIYYLIFINIISFLLFAIDKYSAIKDNNRIRISTLIKISYLGGFIGAILGMYIFHHKTKKDYFRYGIPLIILMYIIIIFLL